MFLFLYSYVDADSILLPDTEDNLFNTSVTREGESLTIVFSRRIITTDSTTDIPLNRDLYLYWATGSVISFSEGTFGFPSSFNQYSPVIEFPGDGLCPGDNNIIN